MPHVLTLICPELPAHLKQLHATGESLASWPFLQRWLERGSLRASQYPSNTHLEPWQFLLLGALDLDANATAYASAPVTWLGEGGAHREGLCLHADPVHMVAGMDHVQLASTVRLSAEESAALCAHLLQLNTADLEFASTTQGNWYLWSKRMLRVSTHSPQHAANSRLDDSMPTGSDGRVLRALMSEVQMALHDHAINRVRERRRELAANALWLWGQGEITNVPPRALPEIRADQPYARGLAQLHRSEWQFLTTNGVELTRGLQQDTVAVVSSDTLHELEHRWIGPLMNERNNNIECKLLLPGWTVSAPGNALLRWLQRRRSFEELLH